MSEISTKDIVGKILKISGMYSTEIVFRDWVRMMALAMSNACRLRHDEIWKLREEEYISLFRKYGADNVKCFSEMQAELALIFEKKFADHLGLIYMESNSGSAKTGQFFTPYHVAELVAKIAPESMKDEKVILNEPSCGGGGMIIAKAADLKDRGIDPQKAMKVIAQDLDQTCVSMCYVQLSLLGIDAICIQGDSLCQPYQPEYDELRIYRTPRNVGMLL